MFYTDEKIKDKFRKEFEEKIFLTMQVSKQPYSEILKMPVGRINKYLTWKNKFDEEVNKELQKEYEK